MNLLTTLAGCGVDAAPLDSGPERGDLGTVQRLQLVEQAGRCGRDPVTLATSTSNTRSCDCPDAFTTPLSVAMIDPSDMP
jgi:hypothetical protein